MDVRLDNNGLAISEGLIRIYNFDSVTREYTGATDEYLVPGVGKPAFSSTVKPPVAGENSIALFHDDAWKIVPDYRGETVYSTADGSAFIVDKPGDYPEETTTLKPVTAFDKWDGTKWVIDQVAQKAADVKAAEAEKAARVAEANSVTQAWQAQLLLGIITDKDKAALTAWMRYVQQVQAVETACAPAITWPTAPAVEAN